MIVAHGLLTMHVLGVESSSATTASATIENACVDAILIRIQSQMLWKEQTNLVFSTKREYAGMAMIAIGHMTTMCVGSENQSAPQSSQM